MRSRSGGVSPEPLFDVPTATIALSREGTLLGARIASDDQWRFPTITEVPEKFEASLTEFEDKRFRGHPGVGRARGRPRGARQPPRGARRQRGEHPHDAGDPSREGQPETNAPREARRDAPGAPARARLRQGRNPQALRDAPHRSEVTSSGSRPRRGATSAAPPDQLSWAESAMLAVLPNSPALIHPGRNRERLLAKRNRLLRRLHDGGAIDALELELAEREPLPERPHALPEMAPHLLGHAPGPQRRRVPPAHDDGRYRPPAGCERRRAAPRRALSRARGPQRGRRRRRQRRLRGPRLRRQRGVVGGRRARLRGRHRAEATEHRQHPEAAALCGDARRGRDPPHDSRRGRADADRRLHAGELRPRLSRRGSGGRGPRALAQRPGGAHAQAPRRGALLRLPHERGRDDARSPAGRLRADAHPRRCRGDALGPRRPLFEPRLHRTGERPRAEPPLSRGRRSSPERP